MDVHGDLISNSSTLPPSGQPTWQRNTVSVAVYEDLPVLDIVAHGAELTHENISALRQLTSLLRRSIYSRIGAAFASLFGTQLTEDEESVLGQILNSWWDDDNQERIRLALEISTETETSPFLQGLLNATLESMFSQLACSTNDPSLLFWASGVQARSRFNEEAISAIESRKDARKADLLRLQISALEEQLDVLRRENDEAAERLRRATQGTYSEERALKKTKQILEELVVAD